MKKILITVLACVLAVVAAVVITVVVMKKNNESNSMNITYQMTMLEDEYTVGDPVVYDFTVFSDVKIVSLSYQIGNGTKVSISGALIGETKNYRGSKLGRAKYFADTKAKLIDTSSMSAGHYQLSFFGTDENGNEVELTSTPYQFKLVAGSGSGSGGEVED